MQKVLATVVLVSLLVPAVSYAQQPGGIQPSFTERFEGQSKRTIRESATREARLSVASEAMQKNYSTTPAGKRIARGALVGAAVGALAMAVSADCTQAGGYCALYMSMGAAIGAGAGAAVGYFLR